MSFKLHFNDEAKAQLAELTDNPSCAKRHRAVRAALGKLEINTRHPGLRTHKFNELTGAKGEDVFETYAENNTPPGTYRIFWHYGPGKGVISVAAITPHP
jgi:hypothetical protein